MSHPKYELFFSKRADADLARLDRPICARIISKLEYIANSPNPLTYAKKLHNNSTGEYRFRIGPYRAFFDVNGKGEILILAILAIRHRREAYA